MPINSAAVGKQGKRFRQRADARWLMSYAAGLGATAPVYFDTTSDIAAHPLFPVCLEWPVILDVANIEHAADAPVAEQARGVHALHDVCLHRPIVAGEELYTTLTITGVEARKPGAFQSIRLDTLDSAGQPVVTTWQGSLYRGVGVVGGDRTTGAWPAPPAEPKQARSQTVEVDIAAGAAHVYTECARIFNPIHTDRAIALSAGLPDIILHGTATLAHAVSAVVDQLLDGDPRRVNRITGRFSGMVLMPGRLEIQLSHADATGCTFDVVTRTQGSKTTVLTGGYVGFA